MSQKGFINFAVPVQVTNPKCKELFLFYIVFWLFIY